MRFQAVVEVDPSAIPYPDPVANPELIDDRMIVRLPAQRPDDIGSGLDYAWFALDGPAGATVTFDIYVLDESTMQPDAEGYADPAKRKWFRVSRVVATAGEVTNKTDTANSPAFRPPGGPSYIQFISSTGLTGPAKVLCAMR